MCYTTLERCYFGVFLLHESNYLVEGNGGWGGGTGMDLGKKGFESLVTVTLGP